MVHSVVVEFVVVVKLNCYDVMKAACSPVLYHHYVTTWSPPCPQTISSSSLCQSLCTNGSGRWTLSHRPPLSHAASLNGLFSYLFIVVPLQIDVMHSIFKDMTLTVWYVWPLKGILIVAVAIIIIIIERDISSFSVCRSFCSVIMLFCCTEVSFRVTAWTSSHSSMILAFCF